MEAFTGKVWVLGDDIDTDIIIPTEYLALKTIDDMKQYGFSPLRPELAGQIEKGDIIVAGKNFGCGSSREQAPGDHQGARHFLRHREVLCPDFFPQLYQQRSSSDRAAGSARRYQRGRHHHRQDE